MPIYIQLLKWTDQGRKNSATVADRVDAVSKQVADMGVKTIGTYVTMGRFDQIIVAECPNDEAAAKVAMLVAGRGNATTETLRAFSMDEVRKLL